MPRPPMPLADSAALPFDLTFPEVFFPDGDVSQPPGLRRGAGEPAVGSHPSAREGVFRFFDFQYSGAPTKQDKKAIHGRTTIGGRPRSAGREYEAICRGVQQRWTGPMMYIPMVRTSRIGDEWAGRGTTILLPLRGGGRTTCAPDGRSRAGVCHPHSTRTKARRSPAALLRADGSASLLLVREPPKAIRDHTRFKFATIVAARPGPTQSSRAHFTSRMTNGSSVTCAPKSGGIPWISSGGPAAPI